MSKTRARITSHSSGPADAGRLTPALAKEERSMTLDDLTVNFAHLKRDEILSDWEWLIGRNKLPILITAFGEAFLQDVHDGSIYFLNVTNASLSKVANTADELNVRLSDKEFVSDFLAVQAVGDLRQSGNLLSKGQVYSYKKAPVLGGSVAQDNIEPKDIEVHFSLIGQIHEQVKSLPNGDPIKNIEFKVQKKPWWKVWG